VTPGTLHVGTSGWTYKHWRGDFYPAGVPQRRWLAYYQQRFDTVEVNATFYGLLRPSTFSTWARDAPPAFVFTLKGSRFITHIRRLREPKSALAKFFERARLLGDHLGPVLWQLPPDLPRDNELLARFLDELPRDVRHVFEFRHASWFDDSTYALLRQHDVALCIAHRGTSTSPEVLSAPFVYLRFHGTDERYRGAYGARRAASWAKRVTGWLTDGLDVYAYFNNDIGGHAPRDAAALLEAITSRKN
jgi:uncharacterized protein YecE (DUF72 family)